MNQENYYNMSIPQLKFSLSLNLFDCPSDSRKRKQNVLINDPELFTNYLLVMLQL